MDILKSYNETYDHLAQANVLDIFWQAYWDTYGKMVAGNGKLSSTGDIDALFHKAYLAKKNFKSTSSDNRSEEDDTQFDTSEYEYSHQDSDALPADIKQGAAAQSADADQDNRFSSGRESYLRDPKVVLRAFLGIKTTEKDEYFIVRALKAFARTSWNVIRISELIIRVVDYSVEALFARCYALTRHLIENPSVALIALPVVAPLTAALFVAHAAIKAAAIATRLVLSSSNTWKEADAIDPKLGVAARVATVGLTVGLCLGMPALAPYFAYIHAPIIASGVTSAVQAMAAALPVKALSVSLAGSLVLASAAATAQLEKIFVNHYSVAFNNLFKFKKNHSNTESQVEAKEASETAEQSTLVHLGEHQPNKVGDAEVVGSPLQKRSSANSLDEMASKVGGAPPTSVPTAPPVDRVRAVLGSSIRWVPSFPLRLDLWGKGHTLYPNAVSPV